MSYEAHYAAVDAAIEKLKEVGQALTAAREKAADALSAVTSAVGSEPADGPGRDALVNTVLIGGAAEGPIAVAEQGVAATIEHLRSYRARWAGRGGK
jgi:hypothetical protein